MIEKRNKTFIDFVKRNTKWEELIEDFVVLDDKVFIICKGRNWEIQQLTKEIKDYATGFGIDRVFISIEHKESIQTTITTTIGGGFNFGTSGSTYVVNFSA